MSQFILFLVKVNSVPFLTLLAHRLSTVHLSLVTGHCYSQILCGVSFAPTKSLPLKQSLLLLTKNSPAIITKTLYLSYTYSFATPLPFPFSLLLSDLPLYHSAPTLAEKTCGGETPRNSQQRMSTPRRWRSTRRNSKKRRTTKRRTITQMRGTAAPPHQHQRRGRHCPPAARPSTLGQPSPNSGWAPSAAADMTTRRKKRNTKRTKRRKRTGGGPQRAEEVTKTAKALTTTAAFSRSVSSTFWPTRTRRCSRLVTPPSPKWRTSWTSRRTARRRSRRALACTRTGKKRRDG